MNPGNPSSLHSSPAQNAIRKPSLPSIESLFGLRREDDLEVILDEDDPRRGSTGSSSSAGGPSAVTTTPPASHRKPQLPASTFHHTATGEQQTSSNELYATSDLRGGPPRALASDLGVETRRSSLPTFDSLRQSRMGYSHEATSGASPLSPPASPGGQVSNQQGQHGRHSESTRPGSRGGVSPPWLHSPLSAMSSTGSTPLQSATPAVYRSAAPSGPQPFMQPLTTAFSGDSNRNRSLSQPGPLSPANQSESSPHLQHLPRGSQSRSVYRSPVQEPLPPPSHQASQRHHLQHLTADLSKRRHTISETLIDMRPHPQSSNQSSSGSPSLHSALESYRLQPPPSISPSSASSDEHHPQYHHHHQHHPRRPPPSSSRTHPSLLSFATQMAPPSRRFASPSSRPSTSPSTSRPSRFPSPPSSFPRRLSSAALEGSGPYSSAGAHTPYIPIRPRSATSASDPHSMDEGPRSVPSRSGGSVSASTGQTAGAAKYECQYCQKRFNRPSSLKIHVNTHTGEKPFKCPFPSCGRRFSVMSNMRRHARVHSQPRLNESQQSTGPDDGVDGEGEADGEGEGPMDVEAEGDEGPFAWSSVGAGPSTSSTFRSSMPQPPRSRSGSSRGDPTATAMSMAPPAFGVVHHHHHYYHPSSPPAPHHTSAATIASTTTLIPIPPEALGASAQRLYHHRITRGTAPLRPSYAEVRSPEPQNRAIGQQGERRSKSESRTPSPFGGEGE